MKFTKFCILALLLFAMPACTTTISNNLNSSTNSTAASSSSAWELHSHQPLTGTVISQTELSANEGMTIDVLDVGLKSIVVRRKTEGHVTAFNQYPLYAYILSDYRYNQPALHDSYLTVEMGSKVLFYDFGYSSLDDILYLCDVDGDSLDEIVVQQTVGMTGGAGQFVSRVFKVVGDEIQEIFNSSIYDDSGAYAGTFDTGFTSEYLNGYKLKITNTITGYSTIMDISKRYTADFFDANGKVKYGTGIYCDSFNEFIPKDVDGDGIYEISCTQYVSLSGHSDYFGDAKTVLKFNNKTQKFAVIQSEFIPASK